MTNKLTLNEATEPFFDTEDKDLWHLLLENRIADMETVVSGAEDKIIFKIITELFNNEGSETLDSLDLVTFKEENSLIFKDLVRAIFALDINGEYDKIRLDIVDKLFEAVPEIVKNIKDHAQGYPRTPINALVWSEAAGYRSSLNALIYYYKLKEDTDTLHFLIMNRTQITLAIMGHYKHLVGPDMLEAARMKEQLGDNDAALSFYKAVDSDFRSELGWFENTPEAGPNEEDVVTLESLKTALQGIDRISGTNDYSAVCLTIDEVLAREHVEIPDFDDDDEDEDDE